MKKDNVLVNAFLLLLFFGLFLGDGKQWAVDVYGAAVAIILSIYSIFTHGKLQKALPKSISMSWVVLFVVATTSSVLSSSIGYSLSWLVRLVSGYLIYRAFYVAGNTSAEDHVVKKTLFFVGAACVSFVILSFLPDKGSLPSMNLLTVSYGHSHLADLLVLIAPALLWVVAPLGYLPQLVGMLLYFVFLYATRARGAMILTWVYLVWSLLPSSNKRNQKRSIVVISLIVSVCVYVGIIVVAGKFPGTQFARSIKRDSISNRLAYWQQAVDGAFQKPLLGNGPGTFALISTQHQRSKTVSSWFAHSFVLQTASEMGVIGLFAFVWLFFVHARQGLQKENVVSSAHHVLVVGLCLLFAYSCVEFVLDYFITWMLFWAILGVITGVNVSKEARVDSKPEIVLVFFLGTFYLMWVGSFFYTLVVKRPDVAFYLAPFDSIQALSFLESTTVTPTEEDTKIIEFFHKKNSHILFAASKLKESQGDYVRSLVYARKAAYASPQNSEYYTRYFSLLISQNQTEKIGNEILSLGQIALPKRYFNQLSALAPYAKGFGQYYKDWMVPEHIGYSSGYASMFYRLGIADLRDVEPTEKLLVLAKDIYPDLAYLHVELAAFYEYIRQDTNKAKEVLIQCQQYPSAAQQCREQLSFPLYYPAEYKANVL